METYVIGADAEEVKGIMFGVGEGWVTLEEVRTAFNLIAPHVKSELSVFRVTVTVERVNDDRLATSDGSNST